jgi:hypothetical protein
VGSGIPLEEHFVRLGGDDEGAFAVPGDGAAGGLERAQHLADHRATDRVSGRQRGFRGQSFADVDHAGFDGVP